ncbi:hypothetical protein D3C71_235100 [compost metagenome]
MPKLLSTTRTYSYNTEDERNRHIKKMKNEGFVVSEKDDLLVIYIKTGSGGR